MNLSPGPTAAARGRPRNAAVDRVVLETVLRLVTEGVTFAELSMVRIAREAGVGKATVYRRWPSKETLLRDVVALFDVPLAEPTGDTLRENLIAVLDSVRRHSHAMRESALIRNLRNQIHGSPDLWHHYYQTIIVARRGVIARALGRGVESGEIRPELGADLDLLVDIVAGPLLTRTIQCPGDSVDEDFPERLVDILQEGLRPRD